MVGISTAGARTLFVNGPIVPDDAVALDSVAPGEWRATVTLDRPVEGDYFSRSAWFTIAEGDSTTVLRRVPGTYRLADPRKELFTDNMRLNNGTYTITANLNDMTFAVSAPVDSARISVFGSSVANGEGAEGKHGYARMLGEELKGRKGDRGNGKPFYTSGVSIGGNTTRALLNRYPDLMNDFGRFAMIGLSLGNEGIHEAADKEAVFCGFRDNMLTLIEKIKADGMIPVVVNNYTRADYTELDYEYIKRINQLIHLWDVASVNVLGAIDDGHGRWAEGYISDPGHPDTRGHAEFARSFVPSMFAAIANGKPQPQRTEADGRKLGGKAGRAAYIPEGEMHSFTVTMRVKLPRKKTSLLSFATANGEGNGSITLLPDGTVTYHSPEGDAQTVTAKIPADGSWHDISLTHYHARGATRLFVDENCSETVNEKLIPTSFGFGGDKEVVANEITLWRAGMTPEEISAHHNGAMLKSSLELYVPLASGKNAPANLAQSLGELITLD